MFLNEDIKNTTKLATTIVRRRKNILNLTAAELNDFRAAMASFQAITDNTGYNYIAGFHGIPGHWCWHNGGGEDTDPENFPGRIEYAFLPWHRAYLKYFEDNLLDHNPNLALPYWDWTVHTSDDDSIIAGIPKPYSQPNVDGGGPNPLYNFNSSYLAQPPPAGAGDGVTFRNPDPPDGDPETQTPGLPTSDDVNDALANSDFGAFSNALEQIHNRVHVWCHGSMGSIPTAAFDPIFWAHHCNIDRLWAIWETMHADNMPPSLADLQLSPFPRYRARDVLKIYDLGYEYATAGAEVKF